MQEIDAVYWSVSYGVAALAFLIFAVLAVAGAIGRFGSFYVPIAFLASACWAAILGWSAQHYELSPLQVLVVELGNDAGWIVFLSVLLSGAVSDGGIRYFFIRHGGVALILLLVIAGFGLEAGGELPRDVSAAGGVLLVGSILTSLFVLIVLEQIYRNARDAQRHALRYLILGLGGIFTYDLVLYSDAIFSGRINEGLWVARGLAVAICVPVIALAIKRLAPSRVGLFVSRQVVFYTATIFAAGAYLTAIGLLGSYLRNTNTSLGFPALILILFTSVLVMLTLMVSASVRRRLRVLIAKHFFENKYDYRQEWLRLIQTLTGDESQLPLQKRSIKALAQILECSGGALWMDVRDGVYECVAGWNFNTDSIENRVGSSLVQFLTHTGWVIDIAQFRRQPQEYDGLELESIHVDESLRFIVPLFHNKRLLGFIVLTDAVNPQPLNFEDYDLLKTAGRQIAGLLAQEIATRRLSEVGQFEAFNKLTAYLMHDLKNVIAQQVLLVDNAEKHKTNPKFIDDAIDTIKGGIRRMRRVIDHLQQGSIVQKIQRVDLGTLLMRAVSDCEDKTPLPILHSCDERLWVRADPDKLQMGLFHALRNAQDATGPDGQIEVRLACDSGVCRIEIEDSGSGMTREFVRDRMFRPFDSTKGSEGMGMGAYQLRETITELGGTIDVRSAPNEGTTVAITLRRAN
jgi:putative PEP-CTERM system histidine kinase